jgi:hypothetical protein
VAASSISWITPQIKECFNFKAQIYQGMPVPLWKSEVVVKNIVYFSDAYTKWQVKTIPFGM